MVVPDQLVLFMYLLMRDELATGVVERLMAEATAGVPGATHAYSSAHLESYARHLAERLVKQ